jgi:hypothetical protein
LETNNWSGPVGRNSLPNGAQALCLERRAGAAVRRPPKPTVKLSIIEVPTSMPARRVVGQDSSALRSAGVIPTSPFSPK